MVQFDKLVQGILSEAGGCPDMVLERNVRNSAIEFLTETELWKTSFTAQVGEDFSVDVRSSLPAGTSFLRVDSVVTVAGRRLEPVSKQKFERANNALYFAEHDGVLYFHRNVGSQVQIDLVVRPNFDSESIPEHIALDHFEAIGWGALYRSLSMVHSPWYDMNRAMAYREQFSQAMTDAKRAAGPGRNRTLTTRFSW